MAKLPESGTVKTRLVSPNGLHSDQAAAVAAAMLRCIISRLRQRGPVVVAVTPDGSGAVLQQRLALTGLGIRFTDQGDGGLGQRMACAWASVPADAPVAFFGNDSPDLPGDVLTALATRLETCEVVLGPTSDGGIWTLAARRRRPELLSGIDWGTEHVYDQLHQRAAQIGASVAALPVWDDVDRPADLAALMQRLRQRRTGTAPVGDDADLIELQQSLEHIAAARSTD